MGTRSSAARIRELLSELPEDASEIRRRVALAMRLAAPSDAQGVIGLGEDSRERRLLPRWSAFDGDARVSKLIELWSDLRAGRHAWKLGDLRDAPPAQRRRFHTIGELHDWDRILESEPWQAIYAPCAVVDQSRVLVTHDDTIVGLAVFLRFHGSPRISSGDARLRRLVPALRRALTLAHHVHARPDQPADFVVDPTGSIRFASDVGQAWLRVPGFSDWLSARVRAEDSQAPLVPLAALADAEISIARVSGPEGVRYLVHAARMKLPQLSPIASLTPAQRRIADLAAAGATLTEIAEMLGRSRETIRSHLAAVYAKLDVSSRAELGTVMARR